MSRLILQKLERRFVKAYLRWGKQKRPPIAVNVEPTNICNLACPICPHGAVRAGLIPEFKRARGYLELTTFDKILAECRRSQIRSMSLYLHGEPFLHPDLPEMVNRAKEKHIFVNIFSNGLLIRADQLEQVLRAQPKSLTVSMDLISREGYLRYKGSDHFAEACEQLQMITSVFTRMRTKTKLTLRTIYNGEPREAIGDFLSRWFAVPGLETIQLTHAFPWPRRTDADMLANRVAADQQGECPQVWNALNICWDGTVTPAATITKRNIRLGRSWNRRWKRS